MKRSVDDSSNPAVSIKRTKSTHAEATFDVSNQRSATDVYEHGVTDSDDTFLTFRVSMKWDHIPGKYHLQAQESTGHLSYTYDVFFLHQCARFLSSLGVQFDFGDTVRLSLRGAKVAKKPRESSGSRGLPMSITYEEGVCLEFVKKKKPLASGSVINFWPATRQNAPSGDAPLTDDWFSTPPENVVPQNGPAIASTSGAQPQAAQPTGSPLRNETSMDVDAPAASSSTAEQPQPQPPQLPQPAPKKLYRDINHSKRRQKSTSTSTSASTSTETTSRKASPTTSSSNFTSKANATGQPSKSKSKSKSNSPPTAPADPSNPTHKNDERAASANPEKKKASKKAQRAARKAAIASGNGDGGGGEDEVGATGDVVAPPTRPGPPETWVTKTALPETGLTEPPPPPIPPPTSKSPPPPAPTSKSPPTEPFSTIFTTAKSLVTSTSTTTIPPPVPSSSSSQPKPTTSKLQPLTTATAFSTTLTTAKSLVTSISIPSHSQSKPPSPPSSSQTINLNLTDIHGPWVPLDALQPGRVNLAIGVVCAIGGVNTSARDEKYRRITLLDHTNHDPSAPIGSSGFTLICFDKRTAENLPDAVVGDVLVVRDMWTDNHRGARLTGSCPSYKSWSWTIFHPESGTLHSGGPALSPHSPHTHPILSTQENQYCLRLADWWREVSKGRKESSGGNNGSGEGSGGGGEGEVVVQRVVATERGGGRVHRLIKDASPYAPPSGYFDCTVEILHGHANTNGVYSLYVTDYTSNPSIAPTHASWCIPALSSLVFKIELWNEASLKGPELNVGEYWEIKNCRIKESTGGYWEGSFSEVRKMRRLDEDELEEVPYLVELLKRKKAWQDEADANGTHKFPHQLIKDAQPDSHFDCTVEILRISPKDDRALLYVTDYTPRPDLSFIAATADWTRGIPHDRILKVALLQAQAKAAESLREGDFVAIRKMRLKAVLGGALSGLLGGEERLLHKLDPVNTGNEDCLALLERRKVWLSAQKAKEAETSKRKGKGKGAAVRQSFIHDVIQPQPQETKKRIVSQRLPKTTCVRDLQKVHPDSAPGKYLLLARVVDHWPENVEDFVSLYCSNCQQDIPSHLRICTACDEDMAESFVRPYFKFSLMLEDDEGERISVALASSREEPNGFLQHIRPVDFREDNKAFEDFKNKLLPLLGSDLVHKQQELVRTSASGDLDPDSPFHNVVLAKLAHTEGFFFWDYTPASHQNDL